MKLEDYNFTLVLSSVPDFNNDPNTSTNTNTNTNTNTCLDIMSDVRSDLSSLSLIVSNVKKLRSLFPNHYNNAFIRFYIV
jgi:hypothetical protein